MDSTNLPIAEEYEAELVDCDDEDEDTLDVEDMAVDEFFSLSPNDERKRKFWDYINNRGYYATVPMTTEDEEDEDDELDPELFVDAEDLDEDEQ